MFKLSLTNDKIWNLFEFIEFLLAHQHQDIELTTDPEAIDLTLVGVYKILDMFKFNSVKIYTGNPLEQHPRYEIIKKFQVKWFDLRLDVDAKLQTWNKKKIFLAMFNRPTASRLGLASYLYVKHPDKSHVHVAAETDVDNIKLFEFNKLASYDINSIENIGKLLTKLPLRLYPGNTDTMRNGSFDYNENDLTLYSDIFVDVVSETHVMGNTFFLTEKSARPIWLKKPFLIFSSRDYLDYMHQMGFLTFSDFWSEYYDGYECKDRYLMMLKVIDSLAAKPINELFAMYQDMKYILDHNYNLLQKQQYTTTITKII